MKWFLRMAALALALATGFGVAGLTRAPYGEEVTNRALLRLAWRIAGGYVEECRSPTPQELERLPAHMRQERICVGRLTPYRLRLSVDGEGVLNELVQPSGARGDRPLAVLNEIVLTPGTHRVEIEWRPDDTRDRELPGEQAMHFAATLTLAAGDIAVITWHPDERRLVGVGRGAWEYTSQPETATRALP